MENKDMRIFLFYTIFTSAFHSVYSASTRPEIVGDILPEVKQEGQIGYLNCSVINLSSITSELHWVKVKGPTGDPVLISSNKHVYKNYIVEGHQKYDIRVIRVNNREQYQLVIRALTEVDAGLYTCQIRLANQPYKEWPSKYGLLTVQIAPAISASSVGPADIQVLEGQNVSLNCAANGIPSPNITWKRGHGERLPGGGFQYWGGDYYIQEIQATDRGQYMCIADNNVRPPAKYTVQIEVLHAPRCWALQGPMGGQFDRNATLNCIVASNPRADIVWYRADRISGKMQEIRDNDVYILDQQYYQGMKADERWYSLLIREISGFDVGIYYCSAKNQYGSAQASFMLFGF